MCSVSDTCCVYVYTLLYVYKLVQYTLYVYNILCVWFLFYAFDRTKNVTARTERGGWRKGGMKFQSKGGIHIYVCMYIYICIYVYIYIFI